MTGSVDQSPYAKKPWTALYTPGLPHELAFAAQDALGPVPLGGGTRAEQSGDHLVRPQDQLPRTRRAERRPRRGPARARLRKRRPSRPLSQNMPQFLVAALALEAGGIAVPINPYEPRARLTLIFADCAPKAICLDFSTTT